jgi:lipoate-protein ligase A
MLCVLNTGVQIAEENMRQDRALLDDLGETPILHLYDWQGLSATYGHFIEPKKWLNLEEVDLVNLSLARRPTGGGIVFHIWDYAFSFLMPISHPLFSHNPLDNYRFVNAVVLDVMQSFLSLKESVHLIESSFPVVGEGCEHFCMARPTQYDVVYNGLKIAGAAQRKTKKGYLHQGTISLSYPDESFLRKVLLSQEEVVRAMTMYSFAPLGVVANLEELSIVRQELGKKLAEAFQDRL